MLPPLLAVLSFVVIVEAFPMGPSKDSSPVFEGCSRQLLAPLRHIAIHSPNAVFAAASNLLLWVSLR